MRKRSFIQFVKRLLSRRNSRGYSLAVVLFSGSMVLVSSTVFASLAVNQFSSVGRYRDEANAYALAKAGVNAAAENLSRDNPTLTVNTPLTSTGQTSNGLPEFKVEVITPSPMTIRSTGAVVSDEVATKRAIVTRLVHQKGHFEESFSDTSKKGSGTTADWSTSGALGLYPDTWRKLDNNIPPDNIDTTGSSTNGRLGLGSFGAGRGDSTGVEYPMVLKDNSAGDPDTTFGTDGKVTTSFGPVDEVANGVAIQTDGKIVAVGRWDKGTTKYSYDHDWALTRYNTNGSLDTTFDGDGMVTTMFGGSWDSANAVAIQSDGKIVVAGATEYGGMVFGLARYNTDGSLDTSFSSDGKVTTQIGSGNNDRANAVVIQPDGKIVAVGEDMTNTQGNYSFALARYNTDGSPDSTFGTNGQLITDFTTGEDKAYGVVLQPDGKIVAAGSAQYNKFALARYNSDGSLDTSFDGDGMALTTLGTGFNGAKAVALQSDGKIVAAGSTRITVWDDFAVVRYNTDGSLDTSFSSDGKVTTGIGSSRDYINALVIQPDGKILVGGYSYMGSPTSEDFTLARFDTDGSLDNSFGTDGIVATTIANYDAIYGMALQADGKIVAVGRAGTSFISGGPYDFAIARYNASGTVYKMWYRAQHDTGKSRMYMATSPDGLSWTKVDNSEPANSDTTGTNGRIPTSGTAATGDRWNVFSSSVIKDSSAPANERYKMWYTGQDGDSTTNYPARVFYATSPDGLTWAKRDISRPADADTGVASTNGRVPRGTNDATKGDSIAVYSPAVIKDITEPNSQYRYKMWYQGQGGAVRGVGVAGTGRIFYATSPDGVAWKKYDNTIPAASNTTGTNGRIPLGLSGSGDSAIVWSPWVVKDNSAPAHKRYRMWYTGGGGTGPRVYSAISPDGLTWTKVNNSTPADSDTGSTGGRVAKGTTDIIGDRSGIMEPMVIKDSGQLRMWYAGIDNKNNNRNPYKSGQDTTRIYYAGPGDPDGYAISQTLIGTSIRVSAVDMYIYPAEGSSGNLNDLRFSLLSGGTTVWKNRPGALDFASNNGPYHFEWTTPGTTPIFDFSLDISANPKIEKIVVDYMSAEYQVDSSTWRTFSL